MTIPEWQRTVIVRVFEKGVEAEKIAYIVDKTIDAVRSVYRHWNERQALGPKIVISKKKTYSAFHVFATFFLR